MKKILVPCDFSTPARHAFRSALSVAARSGGEVHVLHVIELPVLHDAVLMPVLSLEESLFQELEEKSKTEFAKLIEENTENIPLYTKVVFGETSRMILDYAASQSVDLIIMGTRGASGIREVLIGSNTEKIVRHSSVPVLVVRNAIDVASIRDIVFPNTLDTTDQEGLVMKVKALQNFFGAKLHIVWINTPANFAPDTTTRVRLQEFAARYMLQNFTINIFNDLYEETGIINFSHDVKANMLAMGTHGRKGLAHFFAGSVTEDVVNHADLPIWTCNLKQE